MQSNSDEVKIRPPLDTGDKAAPEGARSDQKIISELKETIFVKDETISDLLQELETLKLKQTTSSPLSFPSPPSPEEAAHDHPLSAPSIAAPLQWSEPEVLRMSDEILTKNQVTNKVTFTAKIHETPNVLLNALLGNQTSTASKKMYQEVLKKEVDGSIVTYWGFMLDQVTACSVVIRLKSANVQDDEELPKTSDFSAAEEQLFSDRFL
ncbi:hypothetical protein TrVE_jg477 [Triparma verrucosa]|uniref:Uncharacterized protein n=1 Tax=Triparma verrucosa TaxID=1606542 RepID=A0A9W7C2E2_9STRA|nr:hypothetical protein TrVE_jg477 [Triparma verrucosa]